VNDTARRIIRISSDSGAGCHGFDAVRERGFLIARPMLIVASSVISASKPCRRDQDMGIVSQNAQAAGAALEHLHAARSHIAPFFKTAASNEGP
jgi:hypothetical protein